jgi:hypothetical protein
MHADAVLHSQRACAARRYLKMIAAGTIVYGWDRRSATAEARRHEGRVRAVAERIETLLRESK